MALSEDLARIAPNATTRPFWEACLRRELRIQRCASCGRFRHPPLPGCPHCGAAESDWPLLAGRGRIHSFTIVHHPALPALAEVVPYAVVVVSLDDAPGARLIGNLADGSPDELRIDLPVEVCWDEVRSDLVLPSFRRAR